MREFLEEQLLGVKSAQPNQPNNTTHQITLMMSPVTYIFVTLVCIGGLASGKVGIMIFFPALCRLFTASLTSYTFGYNCYKLEQHTNYFKRMHWDLPGTYIVVFLLLAVDTMLPLIDFECVHPHLVDFLLLVCCAFILYVDDVKILYHQLRHRSVSATLRNFIFNIFESDDLREYGYDHLFAHLCDANIKSDDDIRSGTKLETLAKHFKNCTFCSEREWICRHFETFAVVCCASESDRYLGKIHGGRCSNYAMKGCFGLGILDEDASGNKRLDFLSAITCEDLNHTTLYENDTTQTSETRNVKSSSAVLIGGSIFPVFAVGGFFRYTGTHVEHKDADTYEAFEDTYIREYKIDSVKLRKHTNFDEVLARKLGDTDESAFRFFETHGTEIIVNQKRGTRMRTRIEKGSTKRTTKSKRQRSVGGGIASAQLADQASSLSSNDQGTETFRKIDSTTAETLMTESKSIISLISDEGLHQRFQRMYDLYMQPRIRIALLDDKRRLWKLCHHSGLKKKRGGFEWREESIFSSEVDNDCLKLLDVRVEPSRPNFNTCTETSTSVFTGILCVDGPNEDEKLLLRCARDYSVTYTSFMIRNNSPVPTDATRVRIEMATGMSGCKITLYSEAQDSPKYLTKKKYQPNRTSSPGTFQNNVPARHTYLVAVDAFVTGKSFSNFGPV